MPKSLQKKSECDWLYYSGTDGLYTTSRKSPEIN